MYNHYLIPLWSLTSHRMVYNAWRLAFQAPMPGYNGAEEWVMYYWWSRGDAQAR